MKTTENPTDSKSERLLRLSPAALDRYRTCLKRFEYQDIERLRSRHEERSPVLAQANAVHHALERFFGLPTTSRDIATLHQALRAVWAKHRSGAFGSRDEELHYGRDALDMLTNFGRAFDLQAQPLAREQRVQIKLSNGTRIAGKIDRIDEAADADAIEVIDYKTGRRMLEPRDLPSEPATLVYILAAERLFKKPVTKIRLIYLRAADEVSWYPERDDVEALRERLLRQCAEIGRTPEFLAQPGTHCDWCPYQLVCGDRQRVSLNDLAVPEGFPF